MPCPRSETVTSAVSVSLLGQGWRHHLSVKSTLRMAQRLARGSLPLAPESKRKCSIGNGRRSGPVACPRGETVTSAPRWLGRSLRGCVVGPALAVLRRLGRSESPCRGDRDPSASAGAEIGFNPRVCDGSGESTAHCAPIDSAGRGYIRQGAANFFLLFPKRETASPRGWGSAERLKPKSR